VFATLECLESGSRSDQRGASADERTERRGLDTARRRLRSFRSHVHGWPGGHHIWRVAVAVLGLLVVVAGIVMLVFPGPGWVVIFVGFGIWSTEFPWAQSVLAFVRRQLARCASWIRNRPRWFWVLGGVVCLVLVGSVAWVAWLALM